MLTIAPVQGHQINDAKKIISAVAQRIFSPDKSVDDFLEILEGENEFEDIENFESVYDGANGLFLVVLNEGTAVVGTGAIRTLKGEIAELKRIWLLEEYHGQGIGYSVMLKLLEFARHRGYKSIYLQTSHQQQRAISFYHRVGFIDIAPYNDNLYDDVSMEFQL